MNFEMAKEALLSLANKQGYLTFDNIIDSSDQYNLSISEVDNLSELIPMLGIVVYEEAPKQIAHANYSKKDTPVHQKQAKRSIEKPNQGQRYTTNSDETDDFARVSYPSIFKRVVELEPALEPFIKVVEGIPAPQAGETMALSRQLAEGNQYARERLINMHLRLAIKVALNCVEKYDLYIEDAIIDSIDGLITAVDKFDTNGFNAFSSYASLWMQQKIMRFSEPKWLEHYAPFHFKEKLVKAKVIHDGHYCENCDKYRICPSLQSEIMESLSVSLYDAEDYLLLIDANEHKLALDEIIGEYEDDIDFCFHEEETESLVSGLVVDAYESIDQKIYANDLKEIMKRILLALTPRERTVIIKRYGLDGDSPQTLEEVGNALHLTRERIRQIEAKAFRKIKHPSRIKYYSSYIDRSKKDSPPVTSAPRPPKASAQTLNTISMNSKSDINFDVLSLIDMHGLPYIDSRNKGGRLWVLGADEVVPFVIECKSYGYVFRFAEKGSGSTKKKPAWWLED